MGDIDPKEWVEAWRQFVSTSPIAGVSSTVIVVIILATLVMKGVVAPLLDGIAKLRGKK